MAGHTFATSGGAFSRTLHGASLSGLADAQLLERFVSTRDALAFEALVMIHGPMVLGVCRGVLADPNDAEDAFQATWLILVQKAGSLQGRVILAGWLYQVAHRVAIRANVAAARRRTVERQAGARAATFQATRGSQDEPLRALHEEVRRLPDRLRQVILMCDLQGRAQDQAAAELQVSERTLRRRLTEGRNQLRRRLNGGPVAIGSAAWFEGMGGANAVVPAAWQAATTRAGLATAQAGLAASSVSLSVSTLSLVREVLGQMMIQKSQWVAFGLAATGLMVWGTSAALSSRGDEPRPAHPPQVAVAPRADLPARPGVPPALDPLDAVGTLPVAGRVLDPDGKPVANATIYVHHYRFDPLAAATSNIIPSSRSDQVAASNAAGGFRFDLDKSASDFPYRDFPVWHEAQITAVTPGYGPASIRGKSLAQGEEALFRLVRDDQPIRGRVVDPQGRPIAGVTVTAHEILELSEAGQESSWKRGNVNPERVISRFFGLNWMGRQGEWTTDNDGRFEVTGMGRDRVVTFEFRGPTIEKSYLQVMARVAANPPGANLAQRRSRGTPNIGVPPAITLVGANFEHVAGPTRPITGVVRSKATGQPVAGIQVIGTGKGTWTEISTLTDSRGRFDLIGLPQESSYQIRAVPGSGISPLLPTEVTVTAPDHADLQAIETALELPRGVIITGRLLDPVTHQAVRAKHVVHFKLPNNSQEGTALLSHSGLVDPTFKITVPPGAGMICANVRGENLSYSRARLLPADKGKGVGGPGDREAITMRLDAYHAYRLIDVPAGTGALDLDFPLIRGDLRQGRLVGPAGQPVTGARYTGASDASTEARFLEGDTFSVFGLAAGHPRVVLFGHKDLGLVGWTVVRQEDLKTASPLVVRLERAGSVRGRLVDAAGMAVPGATLRVQTEFPDSPNFVPTPTDLWPDDATSTSADDGRFVVDSLRPGLKLSIQIEGKAQPGFRLVAGAPFQAISIQPGELRDLGDVRVQPEPE